VQFNMEEFKAYIERRRRKDNDQRTSAQDDPRKCPDVETNQSDEPLHRDNEGRASIEV
jgi:hypothetical protein